MDDETQQTPFTKSISPSQSPDPAMEEKTFMRIVQENINMIFWHIGYIFGREDYGYDWEANKRAVALYAFLAQQGFAAPRMLEEHTLEKQVEALRTIEQIFTNNAFLDTPIVIPEKEHAPSLREIVGNDLPLLKYYLDFLPAIFTFYKHREHPKEMKNLVAAYSKALYRELEKLAQTPAS